MIAPDVPGMKLELMEIVFYEPDENRRVTKVKKWLDKWLNEFHVTHTFDREILRQVNDPKFIEHTHRNMVAEMAQLIFKRQVCVLEDDKTPAGQQRPHPHIREDRMSIYVLGRP